MCGQAVVTVHEAQIMMLALCCGHADRLSALIDDFFCRDRTMK